MNTKSRTHSNLQTRLVGVFALLVLIAASLPGCTSSGSDSDDLITLLLLVQFQKSRTSPNVRWVNNTGISATGGLYTSSACSGDAVTGSSVSSLANGSTSSFSAFSAGTYYAGIMLAPLTCSSSSFTYVNGNNYTVTASTSSYTITTVSQ